MALCNNWRGIRGILQLLLIQLFCWLAWSVSFCLAQFEGVTGSVNFPSGSAITCVGNLAVFVTTLTRGRLDLEIGARDVLNILLGPKLNNIDDLNGKGLITCSNNDEGQLDVVMLSNGIPNSSIRKFVRSNASIVTSIILKFLPLGDALAEVTVETCECYCKCIVFWTTESITLMLVRRMPGTLKQLSDSLCLLPCLTCLDNGCHGCHNGLLYANEMYGLTEGNSIVQSSAEPHVVCKIVEDITDRSIRAVEPICICIPMHDARDDMWTKLLIKCFRSKDAESRGVTVAASEALEEYLAGGRQGTEGSVEYNVASFIVPRLTEVIINLVLTGWFMVDGFSSSLVARRTVRDYIVDSKGSGLAANAYLTKAVVKSDANNTCQLLTFRGNLLGIRSVSFTVGFVNVVCSIVWAVLIAFDGGADSSPPPSMATVAVIMAAVGIAFAMDFALFLFFCFPVLKFNSQLQKCLFFVMIGCPWPFLCLPCCCFLIPGTEVIGESLPCCRAFHNPVMEAIVFMLYFLVMQLEIMWFVGGSIVAATFGMKAFGTWIYGALQILVLLKWLVGSAFLDIRFFLDIDISEEFRGRTPSTWRTLTYSSAFLLNGVLAGVRSEWGSWAWKHNPLWSRKLLH